MSYARNTETGTYIWSDGDYIHFNDIEVQERDINIFLAKIQNISYYKARKYCKELEKEGLIEHIREYISAEFDYETGMELQHEAFWNIG